MVEQFRARIMVQNGEDVGIGIRDIVNHRWVMLGGRRYVTTNPHKAEFHAGLVNEAVRQGRPVPTELPERPQYMDALDEEGLL